jgi:hypothetical protein
LLIVQYLSFFSDGATSTPKYVQGKDLTELW